MATHLRRAAVAVAILGSHSGGHLVQASYGEWMGAEEPPSSDLMTHHVRNAVLDGANVTAAQGSYEGPAVLKALFSTSSWPALTGIHLAVGVRCSGQPFSRHDDHHDHCLSQSSAL